MTYTPLSPDIVPRIRANDQTAHEELYAYICSLQGTLAFEFGRGMAHDAYIAAVQHFRSDKIDNPGSFVWGIIRNSKLARIHKRTRRRELWDQYFGYPEDTYYETLRLIGKPVNCSDDIAYEQNRRLVYNQVLPQLAPREREVLSLALAGYTKEQTMERLGLSATQYRLTKSRAKQHARQLYKEITNGKAASGSRNGGR